MKDYNYDGKFKGDSDFKTKPKPNSEFTNMDENIPRISFIRTTAITTLKNRKLLNAKNWNRRSLSYGTTTKSILL